MIDETGTRAVNTSCLLRNRIIAVCANQRELQMLSKSMSAYCIWFEFRSSCRFCCGAEGKSGVEEEELGVRRSA